MNKIAIFIGPKKTGTSWLYNVVFNDTKHKEIRYPSKIGRSYVYKRYVQDKSILVWPYLIHDRKSLDALLHDLRERDQAFDLYATTRCESTWLASMKKFAQKYGVSDTASDHEIQKEAKVVSENLAYFESDYLVNRIQIIQPSEQDLDAMALATGVDREKFVVAKNTRVYQSVESSRISSSTIVNVFFRIKPFLPASVQTITRNKFLRKLFFRSNASPY